MRIDDYVSDLLKITKGAGINLAGIVGGKGLFFLYTLFLVRVLKIDDLGLYFLGVTIVSFIAVLCNLGLNTGVTRFVSIYNSRGELDKLKGTVFTSSIITVLVSIVGISGLLFSSDFLATRIFHKPQLAPVLTLLSLSIPFDSLRWNFLAATRGLKIMRYTAYVENIACVGLRFLFALLFILGFKLQLQGALLANILSSVCSAILAFYCVRITDTITNKFLPILEAGKLLSFSTPMALSSLLGNLARQTDLIMIGLLLSKAEVGVYSVVVRVVVLAEITFTAFVPIFNPFVSELYEKGEIEALSSLLRTVIRWNVIISFPIFLALIFLPGPFLHLFKLNHPQASACLSLLAIARFLSSASSLPNSVIFMSGRSNITFLNNATVLTTNVVLNYLLIPKYGILGAALATGITLALISLVRVLEVYFVVNVHPYDPMLVRPIAVGTSLILVTVFSLHYLFSSNILIIPLALAFFFVCYCLLIWRFGLNDQDISILREIKKHVYSLIAT